MGLNPTILRQVRAFALSVTPSEPPAVHRRGYRASGLVLTSTPAVAANTGPTAGRERTRTSRSFATYRPRSLRSPVRRCGNHASDFDPPHRTPFLVAELGSDVEPFLLHLYVALAEKGRAVALVLKKALEDRIVALGRTGSWPEIIADLDSLTETEIEHHGKRFVVRSAPRPAASLALRAAGVALPPTVDAAAS
jgi:hypothetical protein